MEVVTFWVNVVVVGFAIFDVVVDAFVDDDDARLAFFNVDVCVFFDVTVDPCVEVVDVCCC